MSKTVGGGLVLLAAGLLVLAAPVLFGRARGSSTSETLTRPLTRPESRGAFVMFGGGSATVAGLISDRGRYRPLARRFTRRSSRGMLRRVAR